jgi:FkbM family methyltransferase
MTALDVGAHVGYFTLLLARLVGSQGRVVAVEADPANHALLCENVIRNGATNVRVVHAAAAAVSGTATLSVCEDNTGDHRAYSWNSGRRTLTVPALALDELDPPFESLDIVKLDVQGTEHRVLAGLAETLRRCRPTVVAEFWPEGIRDLGDDPVAVIECYRSWGLRTRVLGGPADSGMPAVDVVQLAETGPTRFCTLLLEPS